MSPLRGSTTQKWERTESYKDATPIGVGRLDVPGYDTSEWCVGAKSRFRAAGIFARMNRNRFNDFTY